MEWMINHASQSQGHVRRIGFHRSYLHTRMISLGRAVLVATYLGQLPILEEAVRETARLLKEEKKEEKPGKPRVHEPRKWNTLRRNKRIRATP